MLIEFRVKNFRSFKEECILSMVASSDDSLVQTNLHPTPIKGLSYVVRTAAVYGANASGKSNLIRAIQVMREIVVSSANYQPNQPLSLIQPFRLDATSENEPTEFEITFLLNEVRYQYGLTLTTHRITSEWLFAYQTAKAQKWFQREYDLEKEEDSYLFGSHLLGQRRVWQKATKQNSLYLSTAAQLNSEQLRGIFEWFSTQLIIFPDWHTPPFMQTVSYIRKNGSKSTENFLSEADIGIDTIALSPRKVLRITQEIKMDSATGEWKSSQDSPEEEDVWLPIFQHKTPNGSSVPFEFADESGGTQKLFMLAGPLFEILQNGSVLVIDEIDRGLHPLLMRQLIALFHNTNLNTRGAQLLFATHETNMLDSTFLRRDQIWFIERDAHQSSRLFPLTEFTPRRNEALEARYLSGRYGAIPFLDKQKAIENLHDTNI